MSAELGREFRRKAISRATTNEHVMATDHPDVIARNGIFIHEERMPYAMAHANEQANKYNRQMLNYAPAYGALLHAVHL